MLGIVDVLNFGFPGGGGVQDGGQQDLQQHQLQKQFTLVTVEDEYGRILILHDDLLHPRESQKLNTSTGLDNGTSQEQ